MVVPIYDENPLKLAHRPIITWGLIVLNILIFLAESGTVPVPDGTLTRLHLLTALTHSKEQSVRRVIDLSDANRDAGPRLRIRSSSGGRQTDRAVHRSGRR